MTTSSTGRSDSQRVEASSGLRAWRRPTLPPLERQYHRRSGFSRPSSGWDRVFGPALWPPGRQGCATPPAALARVAGLADRASGVGGGVGELSCARAEASCVGVPAFAGALSSADAGDRVLPLCAAAAPPDNRPQGGGFRGIKRTIERLVPVSCAGCPASTSGLSTWWSSTALGETWF